MHSKSSDIFKALCVDTRIKIINLIKSQGPLGSTEIAKLLGITPAAASQHLKILKQIDLVTDKREGYWIPYAINEKELENCRKVLSNVCRGECHGPAKGKHAEKVSDLDLFKRYEFELKNELKRIQEKIKEIENKTD
jgi:ArsR family transcriptional regulator, arsenate/arsenite/antimonite-responsive transcriptional repressor